MAERVALWIESGLGGWIQRNIRKLIPPNLRLQITISNLQCLRKGRD